MKSHIVIGSNFGDEGKGKCVDFLTSFLKNSIVVRANGGSQVGHTVETENDKHVFHHFGSGHYNNVPTYFSKFFISNPITFLKELKEIKSHKVYINKDSLLTTPYDMMLNQAQEFSRTKRHGSCGLGINETIKRCETFKTTVGDISENFEDHFIKLYQEYFVPEFEKRNLKMFSHNVENMIINFSNDCLEFLENVEIVDDNFLKRFDNIIFENGQGLLLDQDHKFFPHVTHSKTGSDNPIKILKNLGISKSDVYYCSRTYFTRHGEGPLPFECENVYDNIVDETNVQNEFQGTLRFSPFNLDLFKESLEKDLSKDFKLIPNLFLTSVDVIPLSDCKLVKNDKLVFLDKEDFLKQIILTNNFKNVYMSSGPKRKHIFKVL